MWVSNLTLKPRPRSRPAPARLVTHTSFHFFTLVRLSLFYQLIVNERITRHAVVTEFQQWSGTVGASPPGSRARTARVRGHPSFLKAAPAKARPARWKVISCDQGRRRELVEQPAGYGYIVSQGRRLPISPATLLYSVESFSLYVTWEIGGNFNMVACLTRSPDVEVMAESTKKRFRRDFNALGVKASLTELNTRSRGQVFINHRSVSPSSIIRDPRCDFHRRQTNLTSGTATWVLALARLWRPHPPEPCWNARDKITQARLGLATFLTCPSGSHKPPDQDH
ncbi:hypothetical protein J6590_012099 [Homalodisca vitripennis]|nr:hypothetical protein J6590_012099 [Homalodisca vitripennis]